MRFILSVRSDFHMTDSLSLAVYAFARCVLTSVSVDETLSMCMIRYFKIRKRGPFISVTFLQRHMSLTTKFTSEECNGILSIEKVNLTAYQKSSLIYIFFMQMRCLLHRSHDSEIRYTNKPVYFLGYAHKSFRLYCSTKQSKLLHCSSPIEQSSLHNCISAHYVCHPREFK